MCQASRALRRLSMGKEPLGDSTNIEKLWSVSCQCPGRLTIVAHCCGSCNEVCHFLRSSLLRKSDRTYIFTIIPLWIPSKHVIVKWIAIMSSCGNWQLKKRRFWDLKLNSQNEWQRENMIKCIWKELVNVRKSYKCDNRACRTRASLGHGRAACVKDYDSALIDVVVGTTRCKISQNPPRQWASSMSMSHFLYW